MIVGKTEGLSLCDFLGLMMIYLKLTHQIDWAWWVILMPLWIPVAILAVVTYRRAAK